MLLGEAAEQACVRVSGWSSDILELAVWGVKGLIETFTDHLNLTIIHLSDLACFEQGAALLSHQKKRILHSSLFHRIPQKTVA